MFGLGYNINLDVFLAHSWSILLTFARWLIEPRQHGETRRRKRSIGKVLSGGPSAQVIPLVFGHAKKSAEDVRTNGAEFVTSWRNEILDTTLNYATQGFDETVTNETVTVGGKSTVDL